MHFHIYILFSPSLNKYYAGYTSEKISEPIRKHNSDPKGFTRSIGDWELKYSEKYETKSEALIREKEVKNWKSQKMVEK